MTWIDEIKSVYTQYFKDSFDILGLVKYEEMDGPGMGALIKFKNDFFKLQILNDRGLIEMDISSIHGAEYFRGVEIFNSFLRLEINQNFNKSERKIILGTRLDYNGQRDFLLENTNQLKKLLDKNNYKDTLERIDILGQERFGYLFK